MHRKFVFGIVIKFVTERTKVKTLVRIKLKKRNNCQRYLCTQRTDGIGLCPVKVRLILFTHIGLFDLYRQLQMAGKCSGFRFSCNHITISTGSGVADRRSAAQVLNDTFATSRAVRVTIPVRSNAVTENHVTFQNSNLKTCLILKYPCLIPASKIFSYPMSIWDERQTTF